MYILYMKTSNAKRDGELTVTAARETFAEVVTDAAVRKNRVVVSRHGRPAVAVVPIEDLEALEAMEDARDAAEIKAALVDWEREGRPTVSLEELAKREGLKLE